MEKGEEEKMLTQSFFSAFYRVHEEITKMDGEKNRKKNLFVFPGECEKK